MAKRHTQQRPILIDATRSAFAGGVVVGKGPIGLVEGKAAVLIRNGRTFILSYGASDEEQAEDEQAEEDPTP